MRYTGNQREEMTPLHGFASRERNRAQGSTVKRAYESYEQLSSRMPTSKLSRALNGFGAAVAEKDSFLKRTRRDFAQFLA
jgi:hypothetical protein